MVNELDSRILGERIAKFQRERNLTQKKLAKQLYVATTTVERWLRGETAPTLENLCLLAQIFEVSLDELIFGSSGASTKSMTISYDWETAGRKESRPIISLVRQPRDEVEKLGLKIIQLLLQRRSRQEIIQQLNLQDHNTLRRWAQRVVFSDMLALQPEQVPLNKELAEKLQKRFGLKTCLVAEVGNIDFGWLEQIILGGLGAQVAIDLAEQSGVRLNVGFAGGFTCARVIISLAQAATPPKLDALPIAVQSIKDVVALDANTLVGILSFLAAGTNLHAMACLMPVMLNWNRISIMNLMK
jgi:transcriptional regulator with XRE-family HTH domain